MDLIVIFRKMCFVIISGRNCEAHVNKIEPRGEKTYFFSSMNLYHLAWYMNLIRGCRVQIWFVVTHSYRWRCAYRAAGYFQFSPICKPLIKLSQNFEPGQMVLYSAL